ncbi:hypothetical protein [Xanthovirga aplysinae]|uniref:hypothetical protein n=1 Tax=Xanthovirga aplysinae TaxID=2529853 RepID=UPI0012BB6504|nr:hypothetical protein [Xanthovirga aplysinae]MTI32950.1 hypothetical protein [Xanthovirga aplysinae]
MNWKKMLLGLMVLFYGINSQAQHKAVIGEPHLEKMGVHKLAVYAGFTYVPGAFYEEQTHLKSIGKYVPTFGFDYYHLLHPRWELGLIGDMEFDQYYLQKDGGVLENNNILILAAVAKFKPTNGLGIIAGPGFEWGHKKEAQRLWVFKTGVEYEIPIQNHWELTPSLVIDLKEHYSSWAIGISIGKRF